MHEGAALAPFFIDSFLDRHTFGVLLRALRKGIIAMDTTLLRAALLALTLIITGCDPTPPAPQPGAAVTVLEGKTMGTSWRGYG